MSFDANGALVSSFTSVSQSLSSRAMSFDVSSVIDLFGNTAVSIPFEQGDVFRPKTLQLHAEIYKESQSLSSRAMSFDENNHSEYKEWLESQSLSSRAMSFDLAEIIKSAFYARSQSLSSRAMSFDLMVVAISQSVKSQSLSSRAMSFDLGITIDIDGKDSLNPFRAGRCLSTDMQ